ncbi:SCO family protein [Rhodoblastus sp. 17X3]|uniref:SCO family protein n=1 Tax=Rhodoblastus sp. 17X3 TaxID=3047026 RepID=UPI0024B668C5|nr:SCO family protein [Rhodoblastus sp. 17X3]MDI9849503.1 SCO family protein [Rhodoblastus sp. 17X3]
MAATKDAPSTRPRTLIWLLAGVAAVLALSAAGLSLLTPEKPGAPAPAAIGGPFVLETGEGRKVSDADLRGAPFLVFFGYNHCPDVCPTTLFQISEILRALGPDAKIKALFVTVDPERDTPQLMQDYVGSFDPRIIGLSGDRAAIDKVMAEYRVYARKAPGKAGEYSMDHSALVYLMDRNGRFLRGFNIERAPEQAAAELRSTLAAQ